MKKLYILTTLLLTTSCNFVPLGDLEEVTTTYNEAYSDDGAAIYNLNGVYVTLAENKTICGRFGIGVQGALLSDETTTCNRQLQLFPYNQLNANDSIIGETYAGLYKCIWYVNGITSSLFNPVSKNITQQTENQVLAECFFLRAFCYFYLVNMYGDVAMVTSEDYKQNYGKRRSPARQIYNFILSDLLMAKDMLPDTYPIEEKRSRVNKAAASALLARVYLYMGEYTKAETEATAVINNGLYTLEPVEKVFTERSRENIWHVSLNDTTYYTRNNFICYYAIEPELLSIVSRDKRKAWLGLAYGEQGPQYISTKYNYSAGHIPDLKHYYNVLRLGEQYLIRAEARARQGNVTDALTDLNSIRSRAGLPDITKEKEILSLIEAERRAELFCEWGHRWFDLVRTRRAGEVIAINNPSWQNTDVLYPIPYKETLFGLTQNSGY